MIASDDPSFAGLLRRLYISPAERLLFARGDTEAALVKVRILAAAAVFFNTFSYPHRNLPGRRGVLRVRAARGVTSRSPRVLWDASRGDLPMTGTLPCRRSPGPSKARWTQSG
jgi:hypothetical protein